MSTTGDPPIEKEGRRTRRGIDAGDLVAQIVRILRDERCATGARLVETYLATSLGVSRTPVRRALEEMARQGLLKRQTGAGYRLAKCWDDPAFARLLKVAAPEDEAYFRIAADRLDGRLPDTIHDSAIERDYALSHAQTSRLLARMAQEGWIEKRTGYGWQFLPTFPDWHAYTQSYRFRIAIESAAIEDPDFLIDEETLDRLDASQHRVLEHGAMLGIDEIFRIGSIFHETLVRASGNPFMIEAIERINRVRRIVEYRALAPEAIRAQTLEHLDILAALRARDFPRAAALMRAHLEGAWRAKRHAFEKGRTREAEATF